MSQKSPELVSIREFGRIIGVGEKTIRDGIKAGKINEGVKYIDGKPKIIPDVAALEFQKYGMGYRANYGKETLTAPPKPEGEENIAGLTGETTMAEAQRAEKIFKAQLASLEVDEKNGTLVSKEQVRTQLFSAGQVSRNILFAITDRETDTLISLSGNRNDFYNHLSTVINKAISDIIENCEKAI